MPPPSDTSRLGPTGKPLPLGAKIPGKIPGLYKSGQDDDEALNDPAQDPDNPGPAPKSLMTMTQGAPQPPPRAFRMAGPAGQQAAAPAPQPTPTTARSPQTESANPLTGDNNRVPGGTTTPVFTNRTSSNIYDSYVKKLFSSKAAANKPTGLRRAPSAVP